MGPRIAVLAFACILAACTTSGSLVPSQAQAVFTHGVASGDMRSDSVVLWTRTQAAAELVPEISLTPGFETATSLARVEARADTDFTAKTIARGLQPGTRYYYRFRSGDAVSPVGAFRTPYATDDHAAVRMAYSGDADWKWKPYPLVASLVQENLDFFLFLGDIIYETADLAGDKVVEDLAGYRFKYRENREPRAGSASGMVPMRDLYETFGQYSIFDNHEIGDSRQPGAPPYTQGGVRADGGFVNQTAGFRDRVRAWTEYQPVRIDLPRASADARTAGTIRFYDAIAWGANVDLIVLDDRSYRDERIAKSDAPAAGACDRTMLGAAQLTWFEERLLEAKRRGAVWKVVVISSPIQELGRASQVGFDLDSYKGWAGNYRCERSRVLKFIDDQAIDNVVFLTTDYHFTAVNSLWYDVRPGDPHSPRKPARNAFEIITGPMGAITGSPFRAGLPIDGLSPREATAKILEVLTSRQKSAGLQPLAFASFATYSYAVLTFDQSHLHVQVKTLPYVAHPESLLDPANEKEYESRRASEAFSFVVHAQGATP